MTPYRGPRDDGDTEYNSPAFLDAPVCGSPEREPDNADAGALPAKAGSHREFLGRPALRLMWMPVASGVSPKIK